MKPALQYIILHFTEEFFYPNLPCIDLNDWWDQHANNHDYDTGYFHWSAITLYSSKRDEFQNRIFKSIEEDFRKRGLFLEQLLVRNITLPQSVKATIEGKINDEQEAQKMQFILQKEKQEAERKRVEAQGIADYQRIINQGLTDQQLQYEQINALKEIAISPNAKIVVMGKGNTPVILDTKN